MRMFSRTSAFPNSGSWTTGLRCSGLTEDRSWSWTQEQPYSSPRPRLFFSISWNREGIDHGQWGAHESVHQEIW